MSKNLKGAKRIRILAIACTTMMLCVAMVVAGTYALWSDTVTVENHLRAGSLSVGLERTALKWSELDDATGYLVEKTDDTAVNFTKATSDNIFGITSDTRIVPLCYYEATLVITNDGDVAFDFDVKLKSNTEGALAEQLEVYVNGEKVGVLSDNLTIHTGTVDKEENQETFTVKILFADSDDNNYAQDGQADFDLIVTATQRLQA